MASNKPKRRWTLYCKCTDCGHTYRLNPIVRNPNGGGTYSSQKDWCPRCGGFPIAKFAGEKRLDFRTESEYEYYQPKPQ